MNITAIILIAVAIVLIMILTYKIFKGFMSMLLWGTLILLAIVAGYAVYRWV